MEKLFGTCQYKYIRGIVLVLHRPKTSFQKQVYLILCSDKAVFRMEFLAWGNANKKTLHKTAIININNAKYRSHTDPLFRKSQVLKLSDMYTLQATLFMYAYTNNRLPSSFSYIFPLTREIQESRWTRQSNLFYITRGVSNFSGSLPLYNLPRIWNEWTPKIPEYTS